MFPGLQPAWASVQGKPRILLSGAIRLCPSRVAKGSSWLALVLGKTTACHPDLSDVQPTREPGQSTF